MKRYNPKIDIKRIHRDALFERLHINEEYLGINNKDILFERYCVYNGQYEDAHDIKNEIVGLIESGKLEETVPWKFRNIPNVDTLSLKVNINSHEVANASCEIKNNVVEIEVWVALFDGFSRIDIDRWKDELEVRLIHELSHVKIEKEGATDNKFNDISERMIYSQPIGLNKVYRFVATAYFCYFHEIQSYVSQLPKDVDFIMKKNGITPTKETLLDILKNTNVYKTYLTLKEKTLPEISSFDEETIEEISKEYAKYNKELAEDISKHFQKYVKYFDRQLMFAFRKIRQVFNYVLKEKGLL